MVLQAAITLPSGLLLHTDAYVWLLNPDMVVEEKTLSALVDFAGSHPFKSITGCVVKE